jgi:hypothetical protein
MNIVEQCARQGCKADKLCDTCKDEKSAWDGYVASILTGFASRYAVCAISNEEDTKSISGLANKMLAERRTRWGNP